MVIETTPAVENGMITAAIGLLAAIIGGIVGAISAQSIVQRRIQMENVTQERAKWRSKIRCLASKVHETIMMKGDPDFRKEELDRLQNQFRALLNPDDSEDQKIIGKIDCIIGEACCKPESTDCCRAKAADHAKDFGELISYLLKHDWERAKEEVKHPLFQWRRPIRRKICSTSSPKACSTSNPFLLKICKYSKSLWLKIREYSKSLHIIFISFIFVIYIRSMIWFIELIFFKFWSLDIITGWCP